MRRAKAAAADIARAPKVRLGKALASLFSSGSFLLLLVLLESARRWRAGR